MPSDKPLTLGIKPYAPDMPALGSGMTVTVRNVLPRTDMSYGPMSDIAAYTLTPLSRRCQGGYAAADTDGVITMFAGTSTDLYIIGGDDTAFTNASKSAAAYTVATDQFWRFATMKNRVIACNVADPIQSYVFGVSTDFADLSADAPKAKYCAGIKQWLMVANTSDPIGGVAPWRLWWSAINDPTSWPAPGSDAAAAAQSDYNDLAGENGAITGLVGNLGTSEGAVFFEHAVWRIVYAGPPAVFDFFPAVGVKGCRAPQSIVQVGAYVFYLAEDGFYAFDGTSAIPIGVNKVDKTFFADLDQVNIHRVVGAADPINKMIFWAYPGTGNSSGTPNKILIYNWANQKNKWSIAELECEFLFRAIGLGMTLEGLDNISTSIETLPFSLDSSVWQGGAIQLGAFDTNHNLAFFNGSSLAAVVDTEEIQPFSGQRAFIRNTRPLVDGGAPIVAMATRELLTNAITFGNAAAMNTLGWCPQRTSGRYIRGRIFMPAGSSFTHLEGLELDCDPAGVR